MYIFCTMKPARNIGIYFVSKMFYDCIIFDIFFSKSGCLLELCYIYLGLLTSSTVGVQNSEVRTG
jgi:hypothetical protein